MRTCEVRRPRLICAPPIQEKESKLEHVEGPCGCVRLDMYMHMHMRMHILCHVVCCARDAAYALV